VMSGEEVGGRCQCGWRSPSGEEKGTLPPSGRIGIPTFASHFLCVATLQTKEEKGGEGVSWGLWVQ
jgi:hypothetical protein